MSPQALRLHDFEPATTLVCGQILGKLQQPAKELPDALLYSEKGSRLFEAITQTEDYYLARTEIAILEDAREAMASCIGDEALLVEYGSGSSRKTRLLLDVLPTLAGYVSIDISKEFLLASAQKIADDYPHLEVLPVCADYEQAFVLPRPATSFRRCVAFFPGSTIGNRRPDEARCFLQKMRLDMGPQGGLLIGVDLKKERAVLANTYNEASPLVNSFLMSALENLNQNFGGDLDLTQYRFRFFYDEEKGLVELCFLSLQNQTAHICGRAITFAEGERILLQVACKYTIPQFAALAQEAGWQVRKVWTDAQRLFSIQYLETQ